MSEYIRKEDLCKILRNEIGKAEDRWDEGYNAGLSMALQKVIWTPPADVAPVVHSEWVGAPGYWHCPECGAAPLEISPYCPGCGAKMEKRVK